MPSFRQALGEDQKSRRIAKRLDDLERTNYTGASTQTTDAYKPALFGLDQPDREEVVETEVKLDQEQLNALTGDQRPSKRQRKQQSQSLRVLLTYRYTLEELIEQSVRSSTIHEVTPTGIGDSVQVGAILPHRDRALAKNAAAQAVHRVRLLGPACVHSMRSSLLQRRLQDRPRCVVQT